MKDKLINDLEMIKKLRTRSELCKYADSRKWRKMAPLFCLFKKYLLELGIDYSSYPLNEKEYVIRKIESRYEKIKLILGVEPF